MPTISVISTTIGSADAAKQLANDLVAHSLAACVQIDGPIESVYRWQGKVCVDQEYRLTCKTTPKVSSLVVAMIEQKHTYDVPEILCSLVDASQSYYEWLEAQVNEQSQ